MGSSPPPAPLPGSIDKLPARFSSWISDLCVLVSSFPKLNKNRFMHCPGSLVQSLSPDTALICLLMGREQRQKTTCRWVPNAGRNCLMPYVHGRLLTPRLMRLSIAMHERYSVNYSILRRPQNNSLSTSTSGPPPLFSLFLCFPLTCLPSFHLPLGQYTVHNPFVYLASACSVHRLNDHQPQHDTSVRFRHRCSSRPKIRAAYACHHTSWA